MKFQINKSPGVLIISSFPPRQCGIATYSNDLIKALTEKFNRSFKIGICAIESEDEHHFYEQTPDYILDVSDKNSFITTANNINANQDIKIVFLQHEFGFFKNKEEDLKTFLGSLQKMIVVTFHTVLPNPDSILKTHVNEIINIAEKIIVMTTLSADILINEYAITREKIQIISHGTHLLPSVEKEKLKKKYNLHEKQILSTFGLLSSGKGIETTLLALPEIILKNKNILFLIIGKTHPGILKSEGEKYRESLEELIKELDLEDSVHFINRYLPLDELLEYLQLTDIYLFTSKDRNQAVSGTFSYAVGCGCPVISTPIPHATEVLKNNTGVIIDFEEPIQLANAVNALLLNSQLLTEMSLNALHKMASTSWQNSALSHAAIFEQVSEKQIKLNYALSEINLNHVQRMTTDFGIIQFSKIDIPDLKSGYTLDDNARALIAMCQYFEIHKETDILKQILVYLNFIQFCLQPDGSFLNYVDSNKNFTEQNSECNLDDSNGRAAWALGYVISLKGILPKNYIKIAEELLARTVPHLTKIHSTRSMAFIVKGLCLANSFHYFPYIKELSDRLVQMYRFENDGKWQWFESYLTYGNSVIPEALLYASEITGSAVYKDIAEESMYFLLSEVFQRDTLRVISNIGWKNRSEQHLFKAGGEQPIDAAYTVLALNKFYRTFKKDKYLKLMNNAFNWFLGKNYLNQIVYNPSTGGCYDGLEKESVNLNQGAESTLSYLMARLTVGSAPNLINRFNLA